MNIDPAAGERLAAARKRAGLSQAQVGRLLDISRQVVHEWEQGTRAPESRLMQMADHYGVSLHWLQTGKPTAAAETAAIEVDSALKKTTVTPEDRAKIVALVETLA